MRIGIHRVYGVGGRCYAAGGQVAIDDFHDGDSQVAIDDFHDGDRYFAEATDWSKRLTSILPNHKFERLKSLVKDVKVWCPPRAGPRSSVPARVEGS